LLQKTKLNRGLLIMKDQILKKLEDDYIIVTKICCREDRPLLDMLGKYHHYEK